MPVQFSDIAAVVTDKDLDELKEYQYLANTLQLNGDAVTVNKDTPLVTAVAYMDPFKKLQEVRVYYIDDKSRIRELCRTGGSGAKWESGMLNAKGHYISPASGLSANIVPSADKDERQLKLYFQTSTNKGTMKLSVAYTVLGKGKWEFRDVINPSAS
ncbi:MAG: hypothetical protein LQ340_004170 [Diploschistes diacapsis]|nr:MAG: hypothetical protein LQ340_004170 [Diploschistes diacapsis]